MRNDYEFYNSITSESEAPMKVGDLIKLEAFLYYHQHGGYESVADVKAAGKWKEEDYGGYGVEPKMTLLVKKYQPDNRRWKRTYWAEDIATGNEWLLQPKESEPFAYVGNKTIGDDANGDERTEWNPTAYWKRVSL